MPTNSTGYCEACALVELLRATDGTAGLVVLLRDGEQGFAVLGADDDPALLAALLVEPDPSPPLDPPDCGGHT